MSDANSVKLSKRKTKLVGPPGFLGGFSPEPGTTRALRHVAGVPCKAYAALGLGIIPLDYGPRALFW